MSFSVHAHFFRYSELEKEITVIGSKLSHKIMRIFLTDEKNNNLSRMAIICLDSALRDKHGKVINMSEQETDVSLIVRFCHYLLSSMGELSCSGIK